MTKAFLSMINLILSTGLSCPSLKFLEFPQTFSIDIGPPNCSGNDAPINSQLITHSIFCQVDSTFKFFGENNISYWLFLDSKPFAFLIRYRNNTVCITDNHVISQWNTTRTENPVSHWDCSVLSRRQWQQLMIISNEISRETRKSDSLIPSQSQVSQFPECIWSGNIRINQALFVTADPHISPCATLIIQYSRTSPLYTLPLSDEDHVSPQISL